MSDIPDWAYKEAAKRCNEGNGELRSVGWWKRRVSFNELAKCIAKHEEPPVDPIEQAFGDAFNFSEIGKLGGWHLYYKKFRQNLAERGVEIGQNK